MGNEDGKEPGANGGANDDKAGKGNADPSNKDAGKSKNDNSKSTGDDSAEEKKFSQSELDAIVTRRLARQKADAEENAKLSKEQLLEKERDDALLKVRQSDARDAFITKAAPELDYAAASKLFRYYKDDLEFNKSTGQVENLADILKTAKSEWPELFKKTPKGGADLGGGSSGTDTTPNASMNSLLRKASGRGNRGE